MDYFSAIKQELKQFEPITLGEMSAIRLMNRIDSKYMTNFATLVKLLDYAQSEYYAQVIGGKPINAYQTIYWDTKDHLFFTEHHNGRMPRVKVRMRTYLDSDLSFLEVKRKNNHGRTEKKRIQIALINDGLIGEKREFLQEELHEDNLRLTKVLQNRFDRITLVNKAKTERLTIDFNIRYFNYETQREAYSDSLVIIELKRDGNEPSPILEMLWKLRIKPGGYSKYCVGSLMTNEWLKKNLFKERMIMINKVINNV